jgi:phosphoribosylanthranilate isomerase
MTVVKICGLTSPEDALAALSAGADWLGLNFYPGSKRHVSAAVGRDIANKIRAAAPRATLVGVFVNASPEEIAAVDDVLDVLQFHGDETPEFCLPYGRRALKALRIGSQADVEAASRFSCETILVDAPGPDYGGSGRVGDWSLARGLVGNGRKLLLAGGLHAGNVADAVRTVRPFGVDVASGVESSPGKKDRDKMQRFVDAVRGAI